MAKGKFGTVEQLPSGRWRAKYTHRGRRYSAPTTFLTAADAGVWLSGQQTRIVEGKWKSPEQLAAEQRRRTSRVSFAAYSSTWLDKRRTRRGDLSPRTRDDYRRLLDRHILPKFGEMPVSAITPDDVHAWYDSLDPKTPTQRAHAYSLLATIMSSAVADGLLSATPCVIPGAGSVTHAEHVVIPLRPNELSAIVEAMPQRLRMMPLLACWTALRFGELTELRRGDIDLSGEIIRVRRGVVRTRDKGFVVKATKSNAGLRDVALPPHVIEPLREHLREHVATAHDALLFPARHGGHLAPATWSRHWHRARDAVGRPDLRLHDLRHTGLTLLAQAGATVRELMDAAGHSSPAAALRYQHIADGRKRELAARLSKLADERQAL